MALRYHPDRNLADAKAAAKFFAEVNAAYEIIGDPDQRAVYDDFGSDFGEGFYHADEYLRSRAKVTKDFYVNDNLITRFTDDNFDIASKMSKQWVVEFYAPWCTHCVKTTHIFKQTAGHLEGEISFGAVNVETNPGLKKRFMIDRFPTILVYSSELELDDM